MKRYICLPLILLTLLTGCGSHNVDDVIEVDANEDFYITPANNSENDVRHLVLSEELGKEIVAQAEWGYPDSFELLVANVSASGQEFTVEVYSGIYTYSYEVQGVRLSITAKLRVKEELEEAGLYFFTLSLPRLESFLDGNQAVMRDPITKAELSPRKMRVSTLFNIAESRWSKLGKVLIYGVIAFFGVIGIWILYVKVHRHLR